MRKLLVASQKSGVGKTTTAINLAVATAMTGTRVLLVDADPLGSVGAALHLDRHHNRRSLRQLGLDINGSVCCDVIPRLDVLSPYDEEGGATEEDLIRLLELLDTEYFRASSRVALFNASPFMGLRPKHLLQACTEFLLVLRAEPMALRTLPLFLELVRQLQQEDSKASFRGILLTLPVADRWERDLRSRLGDKVLPQTIPFDPEVGKALLRGVAVCSDVPDSPAARQYHALAASLDLQRDTAPNGILIPPQPAERVTRTLTQIGPLIPQPRPQTPAQTLPEDQLPTRRIRTVAASREQKSSSASLPEVRLPPEQGNGQPLSLPPVNHSSTQIARRVQARATPSGVFFRSSGKRVPVWQLWLVGAIGVGVGMGLMGLPDFFLPVAVGLGVTASMLVLLRLLLNPATNKSMSRINRVLRPPSIADPASGNTHVASSRAQTLRPGALQPAAYTEEE